MSGIYEYPNFIGDRGRLTVGTTYLRCSAPLHRLLGGIGSHKVKSLNDVECEENIADPRYTSKLNPYQSPFEKGSPSP
jgi:hypothetical protein